MDSSSSDEPIKYAPNRLGIALIAAGVIGLVLSVYAIYAMGHWQGIWVYIAIFEPFYSTKRTGEGTGLGLSTVYGIVKQTGVYIFVQSAEGQGTEFNLILPIFDGQRTEIAPVIEEPKIQPRTYGDGVILFVEDEAPVRTFASRALQLRGYKVIEAASAEEALDQLSDPNLQIDVFVTDIVMPGRDSPNWVKEALEQRSNTRVVFVSGYAEGVLETQQAAIPNSVFLPKPFSLDDLTETVQQQFH